VPYE
jgi:hypothetical protein